VLRGVVAAAAAQRGGGGQTDVAAEHGLELPCSLSGDGSICSKVINRWKTCSCLAIGLK